MPVRNIKHLPTVVRIAAENVQVRASPAFSRMASSDACASGEKSDKLKVVHDTEGQEFFIKLEDGKDEESKAVLQYSYIRPDYVDLEHTVVPSQFRGHGVARILAETAFDHFVEKGALIRPTCTYLQKFYNDNPLPRYTEKVKWD